MTSKISTVLNPNIFITNNYEIVKEYFLQDNYFRIEQLPQRKGQSLLITGGGGNKYLQSFEFSYNYDTTDKLKVVMEFVDTDGNFEQEFFGFNLNNVKSTIASRFKQSASAGKPSQNAEAFDKMDIENYMASYNRLFVAFGCGSDLRNWSDVHVLIAHDISVDVSNGIRKFRYTFFPSTSSFFKPKLIFNLDSPNPQREFLFTENIDGIISYVPADLKDSPNQVLYKILKKYISDITSVKESNIIVVLPTFILGIANAGLSLTPDQLDTISNQNFDFYNQTGLLLEVYDELKNRFGIELETTKKTIQIFADAFKKKKGISAPLQIQLSQAEANLNLVNQNSYSYILKATKPPATSIKPEVLPSIPDFYVPLNKVNSGLKGLINTADNLVVIEETNSKILKFFEEFGLIENASNRCVIVGFEGMINEYVYRNYIPGDEISNVQQVAEQILRNFTPTLPIMTSKEKQIFFDNKSYGLSFIQRISRRKTSSNFFEKTTLDELAVNEYGKKISEAFKVEGNIFELFDIPVFTNNLKNSNVLEINLTESSMYLAGISLTLQNNFHKFYVSEIQKNVNNVNIAGVSVSSIFDEYTKRLSYAIKDKGQGVDPKQQFGLLKRALLQQFFIAKKTNQNPLKSDNTFNFYDAAKIGSLQDSGRSSEYDPLRQSGIKTGRKKAISAGVGAPGFAVDETREETNAEIEARLAQELQVDKLLTEQELKEIFGNDTNRSFINAFLPLIVKNGGNFDSDLALLALAINYADNYEFQKVTSQYSAEDRQSRMFQFAAVLAGMFNINNSVVDPAQVLRNSIVYQNGGVLFTPKDFGLSQEAIAAELFNHLNRYGYKINIKTLPFFHLSSFRAMTYKPCYLFSKKVLLNSDKTRLTTGNDLDFFSGAYNIAAFKHVISTRECYSEFLLENVAGTTYDV